MLLHSLRYADNHEPYCKRSKHLWNYNLIQCSLGDVTLYFLHFDESDGIVPGFPEGKLGDKCVI